MFKMSASLVPPAFSQHASNLLQRVQQGASRVELVYTTHDRWPCRPSSPLDSANPLRISVVDSSFNPPTLAHLALANIPPHPPGLVSLDLPSLNVAREDYDAKLLLLSVRNADKVLKPGDASQVQRLEMMYLMAKELVSSTQVIAQESNVAVAIIDEPTFAGKSTALTQYLFSRLQALHSSESQSPMKPLKPQMTFTMGYDTLIRLISPRFYPSEGDMHQALKKFLSSAMEDCNIVCARRPPTGPDSLSQAVSESQTLETFERIIGEKRVSLVNIGEDEQTYSSTAVRTKVQAADNSWMGVVLPNIAQYIEQASLYSVVQSLS
ncbi:hypothetical protein CONPUDRAFT_142640 [Coniophora puteana RWD-64-598 SS2]|uniref:Nicotinamide-nucleotide adenylyltransferase n=1 Tax=Coniophora puteana (strain RWD-64-598) TaxID=741705 RepID=A0A5M3MYT8_CONPW|nr:uncharacterized protein CONPUDRAFT_142640 [Coniophora puteana RWD-64-598 SS2]EIW84300.1 hypothetical protein CONPUDRAFT_142640 [Coniophora puteana RWD-64-598 SS2]